MRGVGIHRVARLDRRKRQRHPAGERHSREPGRTAPFREQRAHQHHARRDAKPEEGVQRRLHADEHLEPERQPAGDQHHQEPGEATGEHASLPERVAAQQEGGRQAEHDQQETDQAKHSHPAIVPGKAEQDDPLRICDHARDDRAQQPPQRSQTPCQPLVAERERHQGGGRHGHERSGPECAEAEHHRHGHGARPGNADEQGQNLDHGHDERAVEGDREHARAVRSARRWLLQGGLHIRYRLRSRAGYNTGHARRLGVGAVSAWCPRGLGVVSAWSRGDLGAGPCRGEPCRCRPERPIAPLQAGCSDLEISSSTAWVLLARNLQLHCLACSRDPSTRIEP